MCLPCRMQRKETRRDTGLRQLTESVLLSAVSQTKLASLILRRGAAALAKR